MASTYNTTYNFGEGCEKHFKRDNYKRQSIHACCNSRSLLTLCGGANMKAFIILLSLILSVWFILKTVGVLGLYAVLLLSFLFVEKVKDELNDTSS